MEIKLSTHSCGFKFILTYSDRNKTKVIKKGCLFRLTNGADVFTSPKGSCILLAVQCTLPV